MEEIFNDIPNYEGYYQASNLGNIKSLKYGKEKILKPGYTPKGYLSIVLYKNKKHISYRLHKLVMLAFIGPRPVELNGIKYHINHKNGIKSDNRLENLEYITASKNEYHSYHILGKISPNKGKLGKLNSLSKKVNQYTKQGEFIKTWDSLMDIQRAFGIYASRTCEVCSGKRKSAGGFKWTYILDSEEYLINK